jgi:hypothetical protein
MWPMAIPFLKHGHIGKSSQKQPYTAAAHVRYISRQSATVYVYAERMPLNYHAAQRFLIEREDSIRKNGRVIDKLTISLPREMTMDQAVDTLRRFGFELSQGRASFYFSIQNWNEHNPHCHFIFVDADIETGKRVFNTTDRDSSERIKSLWQTIHNQEMEALGIDAPIDFDDAAQRKAEKLEHERFIEEQGEPANDNQPEPIAIAPVAEMPPDAPSNDLVEDDDEPMPGEVETYAEDAPEAVQVMAPLSIAKRLENTRQDLQELRIVGEKRREAKRLQADYSYWRSEAEVAREKARLAKEAQEDAIVRTQKAELSYRQTHIGNFRRGIHLRLFGFEIKTAGIDRAIQVEAEYEKAAYAEAVRGADFREANNYANRATKKVAEMEHKVGVVEEAIGLHERINGQLQDFDAAEAEFRRDLSDTLDGLSPNDVMDAYDNGELSLQDTKDILNHMGHPDLVAWIEAQEEELRH